MDEKPGVKYAVFYHKNCSDGFGAAWAAHTLLEKTLGAEVVYLPIDWNREIDIPLLTGMRVFFFDIAVWRNQLEAIAEVAESVEVWDHHKSTSDKVGEMECVNIDFSKSGAVLAWERCVKEVDSSYSHKMNQPELPSSDEWKEVPELLKYVQDNDLYKHILPDSREFRAMITANPYSFEVWTDISSNLQEYIEKEGVIGLRADICRMKERILPLAYEIEFEGHKIMAVNSPIFPSDLGHMLSEEHGIGLVWFTNGGRMIISLRSFDSEKIDVEQLAVAQGGGGHKAASGFSIPIDSKLALKIMGIQEE